MLQTNMTHPKRLWQAYHQQGCNFLSHHIFSKSCLQAFLLLIWVSCLVCSLEMKEIIGIYAACDLRHQYLNQLWPKVLCLSSHGGSWWKRQGLAAPLLLGVCVCQAAGSASLSVKGLTQAALQSSFKSSCSCTDFTHIFLSRMLGVDSWLMLLFKYWSYLSNLLKFKETLDLQGWIWKWMKKDAGTTDSSILFIFCVTLY